MSYKLLKVAAIVSGLVLGASIEAAAQWPGGMMMGGGHDSATQAVMMSAHQLMLDHDRITRSVTNLPNGVRSVTESADPDVAALIKQHVNASLRLMGSGVDPVMPMESAATRVIMANAAKIRTTTEATAHGMIVVQTSDDQDVVAALQTHAAEVNELVREGMAAMQRGMMGRPGRSGRPPR